jgi:Na+/glutamate symporter
MISLVNCLALWNEFKENNTFDIEKFMSIVLICDFTFLLSWIMLSLVMGMWDVSIENFVVCFLDHVESTMFHLRR